MCPLSDRRSPIPKRARSICGLMVLSGIRTQTVFDLSP
jgi:hypothetical protein